MKKLFIAGNWKSHKTVQEAQDWMGQINIPKSDATIVICVPFTLLSSVKSSHFTLAAQDVSPFSEGAYTGEVSARQVKEFADWVIVGHSERRKYFGETDEILTRKVEMAKGANLKVIYCVPDDMTFIPANVDVVAYEPVWAIGTGKTDSPDNANSVVRKIKSKTNITTCIYGGSVTPQNVKSFVSTETIDGVLPGGASLDANMFSELIKEAISS